MAHLKCVQHSRRVSFGSAANYFSITHRSTTSDGLPADCSSNEFTHAGERYDMWELELCLERGYLRHPHRLVAS